ncbi:MAG: hypothetical protein XD95_0197 [Microgenomates bacterium 39_7]|nr:MAG: hypothetical protein XD95_0197 [Microgenomates bacterium 39_7]
MTDRQRAFISAVVYVVKNNKFRSYHSAGVKRLPDGAVMYEFSGEWQKNSISVRDDKHNRAVDSDFFENPWGVKFRWQGSLRTVYLKLIIPKDGSSFYGQDGDYFRFDGTYYSPSNIVEIRDQSQDKYKYVYRINW